MRPHTHRHCQHTRPSWIALACLLVLAPAAAHAAPAAHGLGRVAEEAATVLPGIDEILRVVLLRDYNTRLVVLCTALLGMGCGLIGSFLLLRKRSLMSDALSHATLPGIALAFMVMVALGGTGKALGGLLLGAALTGTIGFLSVMAIRRYTPIKDDAAMGIVLSVFFGAGVALLGLVQTMPAGSAAGLESFIYGKTASMVRSDFLVLCTVALAVLAVSLLLFKELRLICFDENFASAQGWPVRWLDIIILALVTAITVAGLQAVGLILIIAFLITPAVTARLWTHRFSRMLLVAALVGATSGWIGASISALMPRLPAGAVIVLTTATLFVTSLLVGPANGIIARGLRLRHLQQRTRRQHLLRAVYEQLEQSPTTAKMAAAASTAHPAADTVAAANIATTADTTTAADTAAQQPLQPVSASPVSFNAILAKRSWQEGRLRAIIRRAYRDGLVHRPRGDTVELTDHGLREARRITRNHRLWELYLILHADIAPAYVDRDADAIEHILGAELIRELEATLATTHPALAGTAVPHSPHPIR